MSSYIDESAVKSSLTLQGTSYADDDVTRAVSAANSVIPELFGRSFTTDDDPSTRFYGSRYRADRLLELDDLTRDSAITVACDYARDGTFSTTLTENTDFVLEPLNAEADGVPFEYLRMNGGHLPRGPRVLSVTGTFGWPGSTPPQIVAFAEILAIKWVSRFREAPFGFVTAGADMAVAMRLAKTDPDFPVLSAGLCRGVLIN